MNTTWLMLGMVGVLVAVALLIPSNSLTGHVIQEKSCKELGCSELCDVGNDTCSKGTVCCPTNWQSGVCDYAVNCEKIREYSLYQSLDTYQDSVREQPAPIEADWKRFFLPLIITLAIVGYFVLNRKER